MKKRYIIGISAAVAAAAGVICMITAPWNRKEYKESQEAIVNPLMGYAPSAEDTDYKSDISLRYMDIMWSELEPEEGLFDWEQIEEENHLKEWRERGVHIVLRFVCDKPGDEEHMDIPRWLYKKTGKDGDWYDMEYGKGYAPDYGNETFIECHAKAVRALGAHFGGDGLVSYVELGSLGHWGEWHVNYHAGIKRMPGESVRRLYVEPWTEAFPNARILMRRPFTPARDYGFGLYNDMAGEPESTEEWLDWIASGGSYEQTKEPAGLVPMKDFWKTAPSGGELNSALSMKYMLEDHLQETIELIKKSHTTFLGPKTADPKYREGYEELLKNMGYRIWISKAQIRSGDGGGILGLTWENSGSAPMYFDWKVMVYVLDESGSPVEEVPVEIDLTELTPQKSIRTETKLQTEGITTRKRRGMTIAVGIIDPMTGKPAVHFAIQGKEGDTVVKLL